MADRLQIRRDTADNWTEANPILAQGEWGYELDFNRLKIGDGVLPWVDLPYFAGGGSGYVLKELFTYEDSDTFTLQETPSDIIAVDLRGQVLDGVSGLAWEIDGDDVTVLYDLEEGDSIQIIYTVGSIGGSAVTTAQAQTIALGIVNAQKDEEGGIAANDTSILSVDDVSEFPTLNRKNRTKVYVKNVIRGGLFTFQETISAPLVVNNATVYETPGGFLVKQGSLKVDVRDFGAIPLSSKTNNEIEITAAINSNLPIVLSRGNYRTSDTILYSNDKTLEGCGKSFDGTIITPQGDFVAMDINGLESQYGKNYFQGFQIDATNLLTNYAINIQEMFLTKFENIWIRNSYKGIRIVDSDSVTFDNVMIMENSFGEAVFLGDNARSIKFISCNFEQNSSGAVIGSRAIINVNGNSPINQTFAEFFGCQMERGTLNVIQGIVTWYGGKSNRGLFNLYQRSRDCDIEVKASLGTIVNDFGFNNVIRNAFIGNMSTPEHRYPVLLENTINSRDFGTAGDELLVIASVVRFQTTAVTGAKIEYQENSITLSESPEFDFVAYGEAFGSERRHSYTFIDVVKLTTDPLKIVPTSCSLIGVKGGKSLLSNSTFQASTAGWSFNTSSGVSSTVGVNITPSGTSWSINRNISTICQLGKKYILMAKYTGNARLVFGLAHSGTAGNRPCLSPGLTDVYGDGKTIAMCSFQYMGQSNFISLGNIGSSTEVFVDWIVLIEA